jgi:hypothetical protein
MWSLLPLYDSASKLDALFFLRTANRHGTRSDPELDAVLHSLHFILALLACVD